MGALGSADIIIQKYRKYSTASFVPAAFCFAKRQGPKYDKHLSYQLLFYFARKEGLKYSIISPEAEMAKW
jgi:hypothetical protein